MFIALSRSLYRYASYRAIGGLMFCFVVFFLIFNFSTLPFSNPALQAAGCGEGLLDLKLYYTAHDAFQALGCYGTEGRAIYRHFLAADMIFIVIYGLGFALLLSRLLAATTGPESRWHYLNLLPLSIALADGIENCGLLILLNAYPHFLYAVGTLAGFATTVKQLLTVVSLATMAGCSGVLVWRKVNASARGERN